MYTRKGGYLHRPTRFVSKGVGRNAIMGKVIDEGRIFPPFGDWKTGKRYPDPKKADHKQWAWEFLRRTPKHQQEWKMVQNLLTKFKFQNNKTRLNAFIQNPELLDNESVEEYFLRLSMDEDYCRDDGEIDWNKVHPHPDLVAYSWGLEEILDPCQPRLLAIS